MERFRLPQVRLRLGVDCFELSVPDWAFFPPLGPLATMTLHVNRRSSWLRWRCLGICWRELELGRLPRINDFGFDWGEIAVMPRDPAAAPKMPHQDRAVFAEWSDDDAASRADAELIMETARTHVARLHDAPSTMALR